MQLDPAPTTAALIGDWRTEGDVHEMLGPIVVHRVEVMIGGDRTRALEIIKPYDGERGGLPDQGLRRAGWCGDLDRDRPRREVDLPRRLCPRRTVGSRRRCVDARAVDVPTTWWRGTALDAAALHPAALMTRAAHEQKVLTSDAAYSPSRRRRRSSEAPAPSFSPVAPSRQPRPPVSTRPRAPVVRRTRPGTVAVWTSCARGSATSDTWMTPARAGGVAPTDRLGSPALQPAGGRSSGAHRKRHGEPHESRVEDDRVKGAPCAPPRREGPTGSAGSAH